MGPAEEVIAVTFAADSGSPRLLFRYRQFVDVLSQPAGEIGLDGRRPPVSIWPAVYLASRRRWWPNRSRRCVISEYCTTRSATCGGMKRTPPLRPSTTSPGITVALPIDIGDIDAHHRRIQPCAGGQTPKWCEGS